MTFKKGYVYRNGKLVPSKRAKLQKRKDVKNRKIAEYWENNKHIYDYDRVPLDKYTAEQFGMEVYWSICKKGHITERSIHKDGCPDCEKISRSIRDAKKRGALSVQLSREEKSELAAIYQEAKRLTRETGVQYHVDHIRPLAAGGVHHPDNLQIITAEENLQKGASYRGRKRKYSRKEREMAARDFVEQKYQWVIGESRKKGIPGPIVTLALLGLFCLAVSCSFITPSV